MSSGCRPSERGPKQAVDLVPDLLAREAVAELELDQAHEQRIERAPGGQELLCDLREPIAGGDHPGESGDLAARALGSSSRIYSSLNLNSLELRDVCYYLTL